MQLELQTMPIQARQLTKTSLKGDNSVSVLLAGLDLYTEMFDGVNLSGPVPNIFASDRQAALEGLLENPELALTDIAQLNGRFLQMEHLTLQEAVAYLAKGRLRAARGTAFFAPAILGGPAAKRAKTAPAASSESGGNIFQFHSAVRVNNDFPVRCLYPHHCSWGFLYVYTYTCVVCTHIHTRIIF
jgi:hypothetical protein